MALKPVVVVFLEPRQRHVDKEWRASFDHRIAVGIVFAPALRQPLTAFHDIRVGNAFPRREFRSHSLQPEIGHVHVRSVSRMECVPEPVPAIRTHLQEPF